MINTASANAKITTRPGISLNFHLTVLPCLTLREVMVLTNEDMIIDSSSGHTDRFCKIKRK